jgi:hypothetical protein
MRKDRIEYYRGQKGKKYGIYNTKAKRFQFGIREDTPMLAEARLYQLIGDDARKWRFEPRALPPDGKTAQHVIIDEAPREELIAKAAAYIRKAAPDAPAHVVEVTAKRITTMETLGSGYTPTCPRGYDDCVWDPAYIKSNCPEWYATLYGNMTPEEAAHAPGGCFDKVAKDPDEKYYCYDDEDK